MALQSLEERVRLLEKEVAELKQTRNGHKLTDWRSIIGMFKDEDGMRQIFDNAMAIREKDREAARQREARRKKRAKK
jgi:hypothetical protein